MYFNHLNFWKKNVKMLDCQDCETVGLPTLRKCEVLTEAETETVTERKD